MAKKPQLGIGKQRIAKTLGEDAALLIAQKLFDCAMEDGKYWQGPVSVAMSHADDVEWAKQRTPEQWHVLAQPKGNLGQRINAIDSHLRQSGQSSLMFIGTDAPILTESYYNHVQEKLTNCNVVLGKAEDGGVVIMANSTPWPKLDNLAWSTDQLAADLQSCCQEQQLTVDFVSTGFDIDTEADLKKLNAYLKTDNRPARRALLQLLENIIK